MGQEFVVATLMAPARVVIAALKSLVLPFTRSDALLRIPPLFRSTNWGVKYSLCL